MRARRPEAVTRFCRLPLRFAAVAAIGCAWLLVADVRMSREFNAVGDSEVVVRGTFLGEAAGGSVSYVHPVTEQRVEVRVYPWEAEPEDGEAVDLIVDRGDPRDVELQQDHLDPLYNAVLYLLYVAVFIAWGIGRRITVRRGERLAASPDVAYALSGVLWPRRKAKRWPVLSLYALDVGAGARPVCSIPVLTTAQVPYGVPFPVQAKGAPRGLGRVVASSEHGVLWPARRALRRLGPERPPLPVLDRLEVPAPALTSGAVREERPPTGVLGGRLLVAGSSIIGLLIVTSVTLVNHRRAEELERTGEQVVAEVRDNDDEYAVWLEPVGADAPDVEVPVDYSSDYPLGMRFPVIVDPDDLRHGRLLASPYDRVEPIAWALSGAIGATWFLSLRAWPWLRARRLRSLGPTWEAESAVLGGSGSAAALGLATRQGLVATVLVARDDLGSDRAVLARGHLDPGSTIALWRRDGAAIRVASAARAPLDAEIGVFGGAGGPQATGWGVRWRQRWWKGQ